MRTNRRESVFDRSGVVARMVGSTPLPRMIKVKQKLNDEIVADIPGEIRKQISQEKIASTVKPGMSIGITVGSGALPILH